MLCHDWRCIYIHIPKTAGESIISYFLGIVGGDAQSRQRLLLHYNRNPACGPAHLTHMRADEYLKHGFVSEGEFGSYFKFAFVRNPWDRIVSEYKFRGHPWRFSFKSFLFKHLPCPDKGDAYLHVVPQYDYLHDDQGRLLVDFVGRFEHLQRDFGEVCRRIGLDLHPLPHVNSSPDPHFSRRKWRETWPALFLPRAWYKRHVHPRYTDYYDDESREFVSRMYARDIETFGYDFGQQRERMPLKPKQAVEKPPSASLLRKVQTLAQTATRRA